MGYKKECFLDLMSMYLACSVTVDFDPEYLGRGCIVYILTCKRKGKLTSRSLSYTARNILRDAKSFYGIYVNEDVRVLF